MTDIVPFRPDQPATVPAGNQWIDLVAPAADLARMIAATEFVPAEMRNKPAVVTACILYGAEIGIGPMQSLAKIDMVKGRPAPRAELARALALAAGHDLWVEESTNTRVKVCGRRRGSDHVQTVTWTLDDVKKAQISNGAYGKYPRQMLLARASSELVRMICPEVLGGIGLMAEELADGDDDRTSAPVAAAAPAETKPTTRKRRDTTPYVPPLPAPEQVNETVHTVTDDEVLVSDAQMRKLMASFKEAGLKDRDDRLKATVAVIGHPLGSSKELTRDEASAVIEFCNAMIEGRAGVIINDDGSWTVTVTEPDPPVAQADDNHGELLVPGDDGWDA